MKSNLKEVIKNNIYMIKLVWDYKPSRVIFTIIINIINGSLNFISQIFLLKYIINAVEDKSSFIHVLVVSFLVVLYQIIGITLNSYYNAIFCPIWDNAIKAKLQKKLFQKALSIDLIEYDNPDFYDKFERALSESNEHSLKAVDLLGNLINCILVFISVSIIIFMIEPWLIIISLLPFFANIIIGSKRNNISFKQELEMTTSKRIMGYVRRVVYFKEYAKEIRITEIFSVMKNYFAQASSKCIHTIKKYSKQNTILGLIIPLINQVVVYMGTIVITSYHAIVKKIIPISDAFVIIRSIWQVSSSLEELSKVFSEFENNSIYVKDLNSFITYVPSIYTSKNTRHLNNFNRIIVFHNVCFKYPCEKEYALKNISFNIRRGEKIAVVGYNGSGKSTLMKLLLRLYDPVEGNIKLDDLNIKKYNVNDYRKLYSTVFQDYEIFAFSVLDNIICGNQINEQVLLDTLQYCKINKKIENLKHGIKSIITKEFDSNGVEFSKGEKQKIAISRALVKDCPIFLLDEPSSALDPISEYNFFNDLINKYNDKTIIYVSHRLSSVTLADRILMMENGQIVEEGSHKELILKRGKYAELFNKQSRIYCK